MIIASVLLITFGLFGTLVALVIRQKAIAYRDDYRDELALSERTLKGPANTRQHLQKLRSVVCSGSGGLLLRDFWKCKPKNQTPDNFSEIVGR